MSATAAAPVVAPEVPRLPFRVFAAMYLRTLAVQGSWNYEILLGNGLGFCIEPALRLLPGGVDGEAYRAALARQCRYFNAHPYLASIAVGALARAELDGENPARIERFRTALCGPLGSVGDRLVWAGWLPLCSLVGLAAFGLGAGPLGTILLFLGLYNAGHFGLRAWGLRVGWRRGMRVASALGTPVLRQGPEHIARVAAFASGIAIPVAILAVIGHGRTMLGGVTVAVLAGGLLFARMHGRAEGWRIAIGVLTAFVLFSVLRNG